jgi:hypothetical protein
MFSYYRDFICSVSNQYKSESIMSSLSQFVVSTSTVEHEIQPVTVTVTDTVIVPEEKKKRVRVLKADQAEKKADQAEKKADKAENPEKKVKVSKKKHAQEKATNEVVQMVQEMKTAFTKEEEVANVEEEPEPELVVDMYIGESESEPQDSVVDFDALLLDGDETPMCTANHLIAEEKEEKEEKVAEAEAVPLATAPSTMHVEAEAVGRPVFRHEFSAECFTLLKEFARTNAQLPRKAYKQAWEQFTDANAEFISHETARLADAGYTGDVVTKMFKTAKYYLTKREKKSETKMTTEASNNVASALADAAVDVDVVGDAASNDDDATVSTPSSPSPLHTSSLSLSLSSSSSSSSSRRRSYVALNRGVLRAMDVHISTATSVTGSKPSVCYTAFCEQFRELIEIEVARLARLETASFSEKDAQDKLKKTYKNRMFCAITAHVAPAVESAV